jgi:hypothetical protein
MDISSTDERAFVVVEKCVPHHCIEMTVPLGSISLASQSSFTQHKFQQTVPICYSALLITSRNKLYEKMLFLNGLMLYSNSMAYTDLSLI